MVTHLKGYMHTIEWHKMVNIPMFEILYRASKNEPTSTRNIQNYIGQSYKNNNSLVPNNYTFHRNH